MKKTKGPKRSPRIAAATGGVELVFVVDVSSFTKNGFLGTTTYEGTEVDIEFDDAGAGIFLTPEMAGRLHVKKGSKVSLALEEDTMHVVGLVVGGVGKSLRISDPKAYYDIGKEGGAILRLKRA